MDIKSIEKIPFIYKGGASSSSRNGVKIKYIVVHDTGNYSRGANALMHDKFYRDSANGVSAHYTIDDKYVIQSVGDSRAAWTVGQSTKGEYNVGLPDKGTDWITNNNTLNIERCINSDSNLEKSYLILVEFVKNLMAYHNIPASRVLRHYDAQRINNYGARWRKDCPTTMKANSWSKWKEFKNEIKSPIRVKWDVSKNSTGVLVNSTSNPSSPTDPKKEPEKSAGVTDLNIMGSSELSSTDLLAFFNSYKLTPKISIPMNKFIECYLSEGEQEGVRGDIAFIQSVHETGKFQFGGDVVPNQNNFAGIGTTGGGVKGHTFASPQDGIRAQIQHLKAYASKDALANKKIDPRFDLVTRGSATTVKSLTGKWATDSQYGNKLMSYYNEALTYKKSTDITNTDTRYIISILDMSDYESALEICKLLKNKTFITISGYADYDQLKRDYTIIGLGKDRKSHTAYLDYFISGKNRNETHEKVKDFLSGNMSKYIAPKK